MTKYSHEKAPAVGGALQPARRPPATPVVASVSRAGRVGLALLVALILVSCGSGRRATPSATSAPTVQPASTSSNPQLPTSAPPGAAAAVTASDSAPPGTATATAATASTPAARASADAVTEQQAQFDEIAREVSKLRGIPVQSSIREDYLTREQLRERLIEMINEDTAPAELRAEERFYKALGLLPPETDLKQLLLDLYTEQIAGFYDPEVDRMYVISTGSSLDALAQFTYAHEVVHALQDQRFNLERLADLHEDTNDDASLAVRALVEGDASLLSALYLLSRPELVAEVQRAVVTGGLDTDQLDNAPPVVAQTLTFPYEEGQTFVTRLFTTGRWRAVDAAYADLPTSTEQIMHPAKYVNRDEPTEVTLPDLAATLGSGWQQLDANVFGEFQTRVLLEAEGENEEAEAAAEGWDGDRYALYGSADQEVLAWRSVWDTEKDAEEFVAALRTYDEARFGATYVDRDAGSLVLSIPDGREAIIGRSGAFVSYVLAPNDELANRVAAEVASAPR